MVATGSTSTQIIDNRKHRRDNNGAVKISSSEIYGKNNDQFGLV